MTNHWRDIKNADVILINGANPAEAHPVGFQWFLKAKLDPDRGPGSGGGARIVHADPRFTRTSAMADIYARIRTGTDVAYFGGLINYVLQNDLTHKDYVENYTNASFVVKDTYSFKDGLFSGYDPTTRKYDVAKWGYETGSDGFAKRDINHPRSVLNLMKTHYSRYTPEMVSRITGIPQDQFMRIAQLVGEMGRPDKVMTIVYAVGLTHHTTGGELIRSGAVLQLLLGNIGRPGGGMNAERGHANIQGNTDHAISWEILPGYLRIPAPGQKNLDDYVRLSAPKKSDPNSWNFFGTNYRNFMVSLLKGWYGAKATKDNEYAFDFIPKPAVNSSWMSIYDQALKGKMEGVILSGMTATSIGPDSNQVLQGLANLKWLVVMDPLPTTSSEFWRAPGMDAAKIQTEGFMLPTTHWIEKDGSFVNSGRVRYNRASAHADGRRWDPKPPGIQWTGTAWTGDGPDYPATMNPKAPAAWLPFIMNGEGVGRLFSSSMLDGPIPEHYEPYEAPIPNPLHPGVSEDPVAFLYDQAAGRPSRFGKVDKYPYVATSYRLTEHEHYVTQHVPLLVGLQPQAFVEVPEELANEKGIKNGDRVRVSSERGKLEVSALVTKRLGPITLAGNKKVYQIGIPIHWGFVGVSAEQNPEKSKYWLANALTPMVGDVGARTPEFKAFLVNVEQF